MATPTETQVGEELVTGGTSVQITHGLGKFPQAFVTQPFYADAQLGHPLRVVAVDANTITVHNDNPVALQFYWIAMA